MLRKHDNIQMFYSSSMWTGRVKVTLQIGVRTSIHLKKMRKAEWVDYQNRQAEYPVRLPRVKNRTYWWFQDQFYSENEDLSASEVYALIVTRQQRQAQRIDHAKQIVAMGSAQRSPRLRTAVPDDVKQLVWIRDGGACRRCGATFELQYDHVIPVSMGGSNAAENLQILCGPCNRRKGASITVR
ncbi:hypothetical protein KEM60_01770 [Austwickia sp. TVS 96-490-7B]|uniref:HNH endonuclease n=1 Tax=Austwickia sp. TVS 96-490-7B TaxID=2830843 RepID=UPI001C580B07|nr:HNH endonuclease signature motif containing protein [Austwickia sp. TVS 96-490-7B]MBW3085570.1 hypothetical protein [Austwickia sp. TVS 96-490-7B]